MTKTFVLRPNALLSSSKATLKFGSNNVVVIPMAVLDEVHNMKNLSLEKTKISQKLFEYLRGFNFGELSSDGVKQNNGSLLKIVKNFKDESLGIWEEDSNLSTFQKRTLKVCTGLKKTGANVILVTNNPCLQMIAEDIGIKAENFKDETFPRLHEQYTGRIDIDNVDAETIDYFYKNDSIKVNAIPRLKTYTLYENQYIAMHYLVTSEQGDVTSKIAYGKVVGDIITVINMHERNPYGITAMNDGQRFLINALYDQAPLTVVKGSAGTGKTFCTLAVALDELKNNQYDRILVTRKADFSKIGFLPGEIENKMSPYLAGIKDNLSILLNGSNGAKKGFKKSNPDYEDGGYYFENGHIQIQAIELLRGRSIVNTLFIIDETQNIEPELIKTIITRAGKGSKFIFLGDPTQIDNPNLTERYNGLVYLSEKMKGSKYCTQVSLMDDESVRSDLARYAAQIF